MKRILLTVFLISAILCGCGVAQDNEPTPAPIPTPVETHEQIDEIKPQEEPQSERVKAEEKTPEPAPEPEKIDTVSLSVDCTDVLYNMDSLKEEKRGIIPQNGIIYSNSTVEIQDGDSVFDVLKRALTSSGVHLEFSLTPVYNSAYIEAIGNLYEFDCGERSGWKFSVNGEIPRVGCSDVKVKPSDKIVFFYKVVGY